MFAGRGVADVMRHPPGPGREQGKVDSPVQLLAQLVLFDGFADVVVTDVQRPVERRGTRHLKRGHLFVKGRNVAVVKEEDMVDALVEWAEFIHEHGVDAAIARADTALAEREAAKDRGKLLDDKGLDANKAQEKIVEIRRTVAGS